MIRKRDCPACKAHEKTIKALADEVDFLRTLIGARPTATEAVKDDLSTEQLLEVMKASEVHVTPDMDEDEADIRWAQSVGQLTPAQADELIARMNGQEQEVELT